MYFGFKAGGVYGTYLASFRGVNSAYEHRLGRTHTKYTVTTSAVLAAAAAAVLWSSKHNRARNTVLSAVGVGALVFAGTTLAGIDEF